MRTKKFDSTFALASYMYDEYKDGHTATFFTDYDGASKILGGILIYDDVKPFLIELESYEISNYDDVYSITILQEGELFVCKCWHEAHDYEDVDGIKRHRDAGYYLEEADVALYDGEVNEELRKMVEAQYEYIADVNYDDETDDYDEDFFGDEDGDEEDFDDEDDDDCYKITFDEALKNFGIACSILAQAILDDDEEDEDD